MKQGAGAGGGGKGLNALSDLAPSLLPEQDPVARKVFELEQQAQRDKETIQRGKETIQRDKETIQQLKEKITGLETDNANLQARLTDRLPEQTLDTSSSSQELQTLEEGLGNHDQRHSSKTTHRYGFVETRRGSILENTVGVPDRQPSKRHETARYVTSQHSPYKIETKENIGNYLCGGWRLTAWIPDAAHFAYSNPLPAYIALLAFYVGMLLGILIILEIVSTTWLWLEYLLVLPIFFSLACLLNRKLAYLLTFRCFSAFYQTSNVVAFFAALAFGMADGARGAALVPLFLPFSIMVYADALPGAIRHRIIYALSLLFIGTMAALLSVPTLNSASFKVVEIVPSVFGAEPLTASGLAKPIGINLLVLCLRYTSTAIMHPHAFVLLESRLQSIRLSSIEEEHIVQEKEDKIRFKNLPKEGKELLSDMLGQKGAIPWESLQREPASEGSMELFARPVGGKAGNLTEVKIVFDIATAMQSAFAFNWGLSNSSSLILDEANPDASSSSAGERILCKFFSMPRPFSDRVFAWYNWGKILDDTFAINVGVTTPEALALLHSHEEIDERIKGAVVGHTHPSGYAFERINDSACRVTYLTCGDPKGSIPHWAIQYSAKQNALEVYARLSKKFGHYDVEGAAEEKDRVGSSSILTRMGFRGSRDGGGTRRQGGSTVAPL